MDCGAKTNKHNQFEFYLFIYLFVCLLVSQPPPEIVPPHATALIASFGAALLSGFSGELRYKSSHSDDVSTASSTAVVRVEWNKPYFGRGEFTTSATPTLRLLCGVRSLQDAHTELSCVIHDVTRPAPAAPPVLLHPSISPLPQSAATTASTSSPASTSVPISSAAVDFNAGDAELLAESAAAAAAASSSPRVVSDIATVLPSQILDVFTAIEHLSYATENRIIQGIVARTLLSFTDALSAAQLRFYAPQLCNVVLCFDCPDIEQTLFAKCADDFDFGMLAYYCFQGAVEDNNPKYAERAQRLLHECEMATVNALSSSVQSPQASAAAIRFDSAPAATAADASIESDDNSGSGDGLALASSPAMAMARQRAMSTPSTGAELLSSDAPTLSSTPPSWRARALSLSTSDQHLRSAEDEQLVFAPLVRHRRLQAQLSLIAALTETARHVLAVPATDRAGRNAMLHRALLRFVEPVVRAGIGADTVNHDIRQCLLLPTATSFRVVRVPCDAAFVLNSRERVPFMLFLETLGVVPIRTHAATLTSSAPTPAAPAPATPTPTAMPTAPSISSAATTTATATSAATAKSRRRHKRLVATVPNRRASTPQLRTDASSLDEGTDNTEEEADTNAAATFYCQKCRAKQPLSSLTSHADWHFEQESRLPETPKLRVRKSESRETSAELSTLGDSGDSAVVVPSSPALVRALPTTDERAATPTAVSDEQLQRRALHFSHTWDERCAAVRAASPFGSNEHWRLASLIFKSGDDLRQEQLAVQLIKQFDEIFRDEKLPLWLYPYVVLAVSSRSGFIETVPNTTSIDVLRRSLPEVNSLAEYFVAAYGESGTTRHTTAQRCFCESLAAYSLVCYLLQIKDRHNGNMLLDRHGHVIHIDYGFMFTSSPGQLGFESAPFKLTQDMVDVMGGVESDMFHYFQVLLLRGFLAVRRHNRKLLLLVRMMTHGGHLACLADYGGVSAADSLRQRMQLHMTESECVAHILDLVSDSLESWSTHAYDYYQYYTNAIH